MDVAKYIGLFLLKNHFCYIHGLGNLELRKRSASFNGTALLPSTYEVVVTPTGSIDDTLANFIATSEQISISKASNALRDYTTQARINLQHGTEVEIPYIGKFVEDNGKVHFETNPYFQFNPAPISTIKLNRKIGDVAAEAPVSNMQQAYILSQEPAVSEDYPRVVRKQSDETPRINWARIFLVLFLLAAIGAGGFYGYKYYKKRKAAHSASTAPQLFSDTTLNQPRADSSTAGTANAAGQPDSLRLYKFIIDSYTERAHAEKLAKKMKSWGHDVDVVAQDSAFFIVMPIRCAPSDTARVIDSLARLYNPGGGVSILN